MKKSSVFGFIVWTIIFLSGFGLLFFFLNRFAFNSDLWRNDDKLPFILFYAGGLLCGLVFNAILFELAHVLGAKIGKYKILSVNILGLCFKKEDKKISISFSKYDGLTGETIIIPDQKAKKSNPVPYSVLGTVFYGVELFGIVLFFVLFSEAYHTNFLADWAYFLLCVGVVGGIILIYNILPFELDSLTDGYRLRLISNKSNKDAYNDYLLSKAGLTQEKIEKPLNESKNTQKENIFSGDIKLNNMYKALSDGNYDECLKIVDDIISSNKNNARLLLEAKAQKAYILLMSKDLSDGKHFYNNEISQNERRQMSEATTMPAIRAYVLLSGLLDKSQSECLYALKRAYKAYKHTPDGMKEIEIKLYNAAIDKVLAAHQSWELEIYKMFETTK